MKRLLFAAAGALALSACATPTLYQRAAADTSGEGYADLQVQADRWRVAFSGNSVTPLQTVESYALYRSAEITLANGYDWFESTDRGTRSQWIAPIDGWGEGWLGTVGPGWQPTWAAYRDGWMDTGIAYQVQSSVTAHHGQRPKDDAQAFDAREVLASLGPHVVRPKPDER